MCTMDSEGVGLRSAQSVNQMFEPDRGVKGRITRCHRETAGERAG